MSILKTSVALCFFVSAASALVYQPEEGLRPPKRPPPPAPPTLPPNLYPAARSPGSVLLSTPLVPQGVFNSPVPSLAQRSAYVPTPQVAYTPLRSSAPQGSLSSPVPHQAVPPAYRQEVRDKDGQFSVRFSNGDGTVADETGQLLSTDDGWEYVIVKKGSYSYISPEGTPITVNYVADEKGFHPTISYSRK